jgi:hypothetical protein
MSATAAQSGSKARACKARLPGTCEGTAMQRRGRGCAGDSPRNRCPVGQKQRHKIQAAAKTGTVKRGVASRVDSVDRRAFPQQKPRGAVRIRNLRVRRNRGSRRVLLDEPQVASKGCVVQRSDSVHVLAAGVYARHLQQKLSRRLPVLHANNMQRGGALKE